MVKCKKCAICVYTELRLFVVCAGPCGNTFHAACAGMCREDLRAVSRGMLWMCCDCTPAFTEWKSSMRTSSTSEDSSFLRVELSDLKAQVSSIADTLQRMIPFNNSVGTLHHSTPISSNEASNKVSDTHGEAVERERTDLQENEPIEHRYFSLLLTNIVNTASENDIELMVHRCLGAPAGECLSVVKLVSSRVDCNLLDYISFKVILKWRWKEIALCSSTWPNGIKFREFCRRSSNVYKPKCNNDVSSR